MPNPQTIDLGNIVGPTGAPGAEGPQGPQGPAPTQAQVDAAFDAYMTGRKESRTLVRLTAPETWTPPTLNETLYYSNNGIEANTLSITLPKEAAEGDTFALDFRSEGSEEIHAIIDSFGVETGGILVAHGELSDEAYYTRIRATFEEGVWVADITTYGIMAGVLPTTYGTIVYSGANYAATASESHSDTVPVGRNVLSTQYFRSLYGLMPFTGWNTAQDGSGTAYEDGEIVEDIDEEGASLTLYPQYAPFEYAVPATSASYQQQQLLKNATADTTKTLSFPPSITGYKELTIKAKVWVKLYCDNAGGQARVKIGGQTIVDANAGTAKKYYEAKSGWVTVTRATDSANFVVTLTFDRYDANTNLKKFNMWAKITDLRYE